MVFLIRNNRNDSIGYSLGLLVGLVEYSGNRNNSSYKNSDWSFGGENYSQLGFGVFTGLDFGITWSRISTSFISSDK